MHDALGVRVVERGGQRLEEPDHIFELHRRPDAVLQRSAFDQLQHEAGGALLLPEVKDLEDVPVLQPRNGSRFVLETFSIYLLFGEKVRQNLDRHVAVQSHVVSLVNGRHPTTADALHDLVRAQGHPLFHLHDRFPKGAPDRRGAPPAGAIESIGSAAAATGIVAVADMKAPPSRLINNSAPSMSGTHPLNTRLTMLVKS